MQNDRGDFPLSVALLIAVTVLGAYFYFQAFGDDPRVLYALADAAQRNSTFWIVTTVAVALNFGLIGSWVRRTIGLKKQGSRLQKLDGKPQTVIRHGDRYALGVMAIAFLSVKSICREPIASIFTAMGMARPIWTEVLLVGNFVLLAACLWLVVVRLAPRFQQRKASDLCPPPIHSKTLVLGTTPMEDQ